MMSLKNMAIATTFSAINKVSTTVKKMSADVGGLGVIAARAQGALRGIGGAAKTIGRGIRNVGIGGAAAMTGIYLISNKANEAWGIQEAAIASVNATLKSTGGAVGRTLGQLKNQAMDLQKNTFLGDETIMQGVTAQMLTFTNITGKAFDRAQVAVVDVAAKLNGLNTNEESLRSTTIALSKALNDPVANLGALSRSGIQFSVVQKKNIANLVKQNKLFQAQDIILTEIEKQYGGTAKSITQTTAGLKLQANSLQGDAWERLGQAIEPITRKLYMMRIEMLGKLGPAFDKLTEFISKNTDKIFGWFESGIGIVQSMAPLFSKVMNVLGTGFSKIAPIFKELFNAALPVINQIMDGFIKILPSVIRIAQAIGKILIPVFKLIKPVLDILIPIIDVLVKAMVGFADIIAAVLGPVIKAITWVLDKIPGAVSALQTANAGGPSGYVPDMAGGASAEFYGSTPVSSQTSTINRNTRNTVDFNFNNPPPGTSVKSTGPSAPPITINTGNMRGQRYGL
jgi:hypothetical protein